MSARRRFRMRSIYVNGCPCWECPVCGDRWPPSMSARAFEHELNAHQPAGGTP